MQDKHSEEAAEVGLLLIGKSSTNNPNYRQYKCPEGHLIDLQVQHVRRNNWKCKHCYEDRLAKIAESIGYELIGPSELGAYFRKYKKDCGCIEDLRTNSVAVTKDKRESNLVTCKTCYRKNLSACAEESNITLLEDIDTYNIRIKFNSCGHYKDAKKSQVIRKNLECKECWSILLAKEAKDEGLEYLGYIENRKHLYLLPCGCEKELEPCDVRRGSWICQEHDFTHYNKPCDIYLNLGFADGLSFIKVGIANNMFERVKGFGGKGVRWANMLCIGFDTKREALKYEKEFHRKFKHLRLDCDTMKNYIISGFTECYPMDAYAEINKHLSELYRRFGCAIRFRKG